MKFVACFTDSGKRYNLKLIHSRKKSALKVSNLVFKSLAVLIVLHYGCDPFQTSLRFQFVQASNSNNDPRPPPPPIPPRTDRFPSRKDEFDNGRQRRRDVSPGERYDEKDQQWARPPDNYQHDEDMQYNTRSYSGNPNVDEQRSPVPRRSPSELQSINFSQNTNRPQDSNSPISSSSSPIHYNFPSKEYKTDDDRGFKKGAQEDEKDMDFFPPSTGWEPERERELNNEGDQSSPLQTKYASPRNDALTRFSSTNTGKIKLAIACTSVGWLGGSFIGKSTMNRPMPMCWIFGCLFWFMHLLRNAYGEMSRSLGFSLIQLYRRSKMVRKQYKTGVHLKSALGVGQRQPFPPFDVNDRNAVENPWRYKPYKEGLPDFDMVKSIICIGLIGSFIGGNMPLIPTWIGSASGAVTLAFIGTLKSARGDLVRTMGMRIVAFVGEIIEVNDELSIVSKVGTVVGKILDKMLILDRKHKVRERLTKIFTQIYNILSRTVSKVQEDIQQ